MEYISTKSTSTMGGLSAIQEFYNHTNIFITGGTGFYGQVLIEKLLRSCPTISKIYILVRNKNGIDSNTRIKELFDGDLFKELKKICPNFSTKIVKINGDLVLPGLGISSEDKELLVKKINIIFHAGSSVNFNVKLATAILMNCRATRDIVHLAHQMPNLKAIMYVSTIYSNFIHDIIEERIYPPMYDSNTLISLAEYLPEDIVKGIARVLLQNYPNCYMFTKHIAEAIILHHGHNLPIGIQRPSIVVSTYKEPIESWINNIYGPTGVVVNAGLGLLRVCLGIIEHEANLVPVDMCINSLICSAWDVGDTFEKAKNERSNYELPVYNYESTNDARLQWKYFFDKVKEHGLKCPSIKARWYYTLYLSQYSEIYALLKLLLHTIPAIIFDAALFCGGKSPKMVKISSKINKLCDALSIVPMKKFTFKSDNVRRLLNRMSEKDRKIFSFDLKELDWDKFLENYVYGLRLYILKESMESLPEAKIRFNRLYWMHQFTKIMIGSIICGIIWFVIIQFINCG